MDNPIKITPDPESVAWVVRMLRHLDILKPDDPADLLRCEMVQLPEVFVIPRPGGRNLRVVFSTAYDIGDASAEEYTVGQAEAPNNRRS